MKCEKCKTKEYTANNDFFINIAEKNECNTYIILKLCKTCYLKVNKFYYKNGIPEYISRKQHKQYLIKKNI